MTEETNTTTESTTEPASSAETQNTDMPGPVPYDRFQEVNKQLSDLKKWKAEQDKLNKDRQKQQDDVEAQRLTEEKKFQELADKHKLEAEQHAKRAEELEAQNRLFILRDAFKSEAEKANLTFTTNTAANDAFKLADLDGLEIGENGTVAGMDNVLKELHKSRPYLFSQSKAPDIDASKGTTKSSKELDEERKKELRQRHRF